MQRPRDREGSDTSEETGAQRVGAERVRRRELSCSWSGRQGTHGASRGRTALGSYSESELLLLLFL